MQVASMWAPQYKHIPCLFYRMRQKAHIYVYIYIYIYIYTVQAPRLKYSIPRLEGKIVKMDNFIASLMSTNAPRVFFPHLCIPCIVLIDQNRKVWLLVIGVILMLEFSSSLTWHWRWWSPFERKDKTRKIYLYLRQCCSHRTPTSISGPRPSPLLHWLFQSIWTGRLRCLQTICVSKQWRAVCHRHT